MKQLLLASIVFIPTIAYAGTDEPATSVTICGGNGTCYDPSVQDSAFTAQERYELDTMLAKMQRVVNRIDDRIASQKKIELANEEKRLSQCKITFPIHLGCPSKAEMFDLSHVKFDDDWEPKE